MNEPQKIERSAELTEAINERDRILTDMDIEGAKAFIEKHGGNVPKRPLDWERVLHLARFEVTTMPPELKTTSQIYLARTGAQSLMSLPPSSAYVNVALNLIFPKTMTDAAIKKFDAMNRKA